MGRNAKSIHKIISIEIKGPQFPFNSFIFVCMLDLSHQNYQWISSFFFNKLINPTFKNAVSHPLSLHSDSIALIWVFIQGL